jgi:predicted outer membrane repeat protein
LGADIFLSASVDIASSGTGITIYNRDELVINGNGFSVDGQRSVRCFFVDTSAASITFNDVTMCNCASLGDGGAIYISGTVSSLTLNHCSLFSNSAASGGGGIFAFGKDLVLNDCTIDDNSAFNGGAIYAYDAKLTLSGCLVRYNNCASFGNGLYLYKGSAILVGNLFTGNNIDGQGVDVYNYQCLAMVTVLSSCLENTFNAGSGILLYACDSFPSDLMSGSCDPCSLSTPFACCGSLECTSSMEICTSEENDVCLQESSLSELSFQQNTFDVLRIAFVKSIITICLFALLASCAIACAICRRIQLSKEENELNPDYTKLADVFYGAK